MNKIQDAIDFFEINDGWNRKEVIEDIIGEIKELKGNALDEIGLEWDGECLMILDDFAEQYFDKIIEGVCNVLKSLESEGE